MLSQTDIVIQIIIDSLSGESQAMNYVTDLYWFFLEHSIEYGKPGCDARTNGLSNNIPSEHHSISLAFCRKYALDIK